MSVCSVVIVVDCVDVDGADDVAAVHSPMSVSSHLRHTLLMFTMIGGHALPFGGHPPTLLSSLGSLLFPLSLLSGLSSAAAD